MSHRYAASRSSGRIDNGQVTIDVVATEGVTDSALFDEIDRTSEQYLQFILHVEEGREAPMRVGSELHHHIHVAVGAEVVAHHRAEERQLHDLPAPAEL